MNKPTVFFSHSSQDAGPLSRLREFILSKTGNSVQIFLSSDGQSIPFGRNWVHSIEAALNEAKLMFIFLSPSALASPGWVNFESGHAYSRGIRVIPVGVFGVRIEHLSPPLSLLQGFNITDPSRASNIIAIINQTFELSHPEEITTDEFNRIFAGPGASGLSVFADITPLVDELSVSQDIPQRDSLFQQELKAVDNYLNEANIIHQYSATDNYDMLRTHGISFEINHSRGNSHTNITILIDPLISQHSFSLLDRIRHLIPSVFGSNETIVKIKLAKQVQELSETHKITSRIYNTDVNICSDGDYQFRNCKFKIDHYRSWRRTSERDSSCVTIRASTISFVEIPFYELLRILFESGILFISEEDFN